MAANDLVTVAEAKTFMGVTSSSDDTLIQTLVSGVTNDIENYCSTAFVISAFTELHEGMMKMIFLRRYPVTAVTSITASGGTNTVPSTDYWIDTERGVLEHFGRFPIPTNTAGQRTRWSVVYSAGRYAATANVAAELKLACNRLIADAYERRTGGVSAVSVGDMNVSYARGATASDAWPPEVLLSLGPYRSYQAA